MKTKVKSFFVNIFICLIVLSVPVLLCLYAFQAKKYTDLKKEIIQLEKKQEQLVEENKKLVSDIAVLSSADRIEKIASEDLGMHKSEKAEIVRVEMTGEKK